MKGMIQMTILEPLVHFYQKLRSCCWHNNIKIVFLSFCSTCTACKELFSSQFHSFGSTFLLHTQRHPRWHKQSSKQHPSAAETANWKLTCAILTGKKKNSSHMAMDLLLVLWNDCNYTHPGYALLGLVFSFQRFQQPIVFESRPTSQVWRMRSPNQHSSGYKDTGQPPDHDRLSPHMQDTPFIRTL